MDSQTARRGVVLGASSSVSTQTTGSVPIASGSTTISTMTIRNDELAIVSREYSYVVSDPSYTSGPLLRRAIHNRHHGCRLIVGMTYNSSRIR
jgi:hypothetical protein